MTVLAHHTLAELREWLAAIDYEVHQIDLAYRPFASVWLARDPAAHAEWASDWRAFGARYGSAHSRAQVALTVGAALPFPDNAIPAEDEWQRVLHALSPTPGTVGKGDLQDLYSRLVGALGRPIDLSKIPQPRAADLDLDAYKAADTTVHALEKAAAALPVQRAGLFAALLIGAGIVGAVLSAKVVAR